MTQLKRVGYSSVQARDYIHLMQLLRSDFRYESDKDRIVAIISNHNGYEIIYWVPTP